MAREIKFRAWNTETRKMVDLARITPLALDAGMNTQLAMQGGSGLFIPLIPGMEIMQFTGLLDKNGKEIYENDLVLITDLDGESCVEQITWSYGLLYYLEDGPGWNDTLEVLGNVHEHPHLLSPTP